jgi:hypothetical protein
MGITSPWARAGWAMQTFLLGFPSLSLLQDLELRLLSLKASGLDFSRTDED